MRGLTIPVLLGLAACTAAPSPPVPATDVGLFSSLPLLWEERENVGDLLGAKAKRPWTAAALARAGKVVPIDRLDKVPEGLDVLVLAQPRALAPDENVALDDWVRAGGHVLLFADPLLTAESRFALGDRRRPQDTVMLSPILTRWGLQLNFDDEQEPGQREAMVAGVQLPVAMYGAFSATGKDCTIADGGLSARCRIGKGTVLAIADAALLEAGNDKDRAERSNALNALIASAAR